MFDFAADARNEGGIQGRNDKGLVTYGRDLKKDAFFIYKAYRTKEPMVYIAGRRWVDRAPEERNITVYTNCDNVTLYLNGAEVETKAAVDHCVVFENVALADGENAVCVKGWLMKLGNLTVASMLTTLRDMMGFMTLGQGSGSLMGEITAKDLAQLNRLLSRVKK